MHFILFSLAVFAFLGVSTSEPTPNIIPIEGGANGTGRTTRYWDCCKPSCSWSENLSDKTKTPATSCAADGVTKVDKGSMSGCDGGPAFMCSNQNAFVINSTLAYGFAAASFMGGADTHLCCSCMLLTFGGELEGTGKKMVVQVTNTGSDLYQNHFDIAIPGGGFGIFNQGCNNQWDTETNPWVDDNGSVVERSQCSMLPESLQQGCQFRFDWMQGSSNPPVEFQQVQCPAELVALTGCEY
ncbi:hypothetical protein JTB14_010131 [Gonioctena quinquepunctata]|nr:hypothetical protein JTB14_010131 [Gonioctena quinquepunctata]